MKEQLLTLLKTKFVGVQDAILNRMAEKLAKTAKTEEEVATAIEGVTIQQLIESYGDSRATDAATKAVKNLKKELGLEDEPEKKQKQRQADDEGAPEWAKDLRRKLDEDFGALKLKVEGFEKSRTKEGLMTKVTLKLKEKGVDEVFIPLLTRNLSIESEDGLDNLVDELHNDYKATVQKAADKGVVLSIPGGSGGDGKGAGEAVGKAMAEKRNKGASEGVAAKKI